MNEDESTKALLERLCSLQEQQLVKISEAMERAAAARERMETAGRGLNDLLTKLEEAQKAQRKRGAGYLLDAWVRTLLLVFMLGVVAVAVIVAHYLK